MISMGTVYAARAFSFSRPPTSGTVTFTFNFSDSTSFQLPVAHNDTGSALEALFATAGMTEVAVSKDSTELRIQFHGVEKDVTSWSKTGSFSGSGGPANITEQTGLAGGIPGSDPVVRYENESTFSEVTIVPPTNGMAAIWYPGLGATKNSDASLMEVVTTTETYKVPSTYLVSICWGGVAQNAFDAIKFDGVAQTLYDGDDSDEWVEYIDLVPTCTVTFHEQ